MVSDKFNSDFRGIWKALNQKIETENKTETRYGNSHLWLKHSRVWRGHYLSWRPAWATLWDPVSTNKNHPYQTVINQFYIKHQWDMSALVTIQYVNLVAAYAF